MTEPQPAIEHSTITQAFERVRASHAGGIVPFVCGGHPSIDVLPDLIAAMARPEVPVIEVGIPFSDPIADGPVIAAAMHDSLTRGVTPIHVFEAMGKARTACSEEGTALVAMVSVSLVHAMGPRLFAEHAAEAGLAGLIIPDAPVEESGELAQIIRGCGLDMTLLIAPTTSSDRAEQIAGACSGFVYLMARKGITGTQSGGPAEGLGDRVRSLRGVTDLPIACGFGISTSEDVQSVVREAGADAAIVGTAIVKRLEGTSGSASVSALSAMMDELSAGLAT